MCVGKPPAFKFLHDGLSSLVFWPQFMFLSPLSLYVISFRMKYIETELKKKKGMVEAEVQKVKVKNPEDLLYELPESIRVNSAKKTEEMLSNQMLSGIPEVDLGIE